MQATLFAKVRQFAADALTAGTSQSAMNARGDLCVAQALPQKAELVRLGYSFSARIPLANHFNTVAAQPTTRAELVLYNNSPNKSYIIDYVEFLADTTQAAATQVALLGQIVPNNVVIVAAPTNNAAVLRSNRSGSQNASSSLIAIANTAFAIADRWDVLGSNASAASASIGLAAYAECFGSYIIPPAGAFCINAIVGTAAATSATMGLMWHEVAVDRA